MKRKAVKRNVVLVCGGRDYHNRRKVFRVLDIVHEERPITKVVQGYAKGVDQLAHDWAVVHKIPSSGTDYQITHGMWRSEGKSAGYNRNKAMRDNEKPDIVVAFPGGTGTKMMIALANEKGIMILTVPPDKGE